MNDWKEYKLEDIAIINPTESITKGSIAKNVPMEMLKPFSKGVTGYFLEAYNGGMKFRNGDTIVARITPCLENGKTAYIDFLDNDEVGFGSTEYIVLRERQGKSDKHFLFYFSISSDFRDTAILSMTGSSGRQRVQTDVVRNHIFIFPPLCEQKAIASVLSSLDDKIDLLHRQNKTLEEMAEIVYRQLFIEEADDSWEENELRNYIDVVDNRGKTPPNSEVETEYPLIEANALNGEVRLVNYSVIKKYVSYETYNSWFRDRLSKYDTIITTVGANIGAMAMYAIERGNIAQNIIGLSAKTISPFFLYQMLKNRNNEIIQLDIGGVQPSIKVPHLLSLLISIPPKEKEMKFDQIMAPLMKKMELNYLQMTNLEKLRDTLLPKLMNGEVSVQF